MGILPFQKRVEMPKIFRRGVILKHRRFKEEAFFFCTSIASRKGEGEGVGGCFEQQAGVF